MSLTLILLLFGAGFFSSAMNAVAGGGTFLTFGALTLAGIPPISANATSSIAQFPGYITSTVAYWSDIKRFWRGAILLAIASVIGSLAGALILLALDNPAFRTLVPWLLIGATALFAAGPWLKPKPRQGGEAAVGSLVGLLTQGVTSVYGGFFGAGMGVMMLATLGLTQAGDYHRLNALKNMLAMVIAACRHRGLRLGRRRRLARGRGHGPGRRARRLCRRLAGQARAAGRGARSSSSPSVCSWRSIIS